MEAWKSFRTVVFARVAQVLVVLKQSSRIKMRLADRFITLEDPCRLFVVECTLSGTQGNKSGAEEPSSPPLPNASASKEESAQFILGG
jgi:hypothetical protein